MERHVSWAETKERELEKKLLADYSEEEVQKHLMFFTSMIRRAGTEEERKAAGYIKKRLDEYGIDSTIHEFDAYISLPGEASLEILSPVQASLPCLPRIFITPTPPEGMEGEVIFLGKGLEADYRGIDPRGKIVLLEPGGTEGRMDAARVGQEKGAAAQIHVTSGQHRAINFGQFRTTWGTPTWETFDKAPKTPAIAICEEDGRFLIDLTAKGRVVVRLKADASRGYRKIRLPVGRLKGVTEPEKYILLGGHYCSWFIGATDNAVGNALMLEMARVLSRHRKKLNRGITFAWWPGHEQGTYAGSTWFLDHFWDDIRDNAVAYLVLDGLGRTGSSGFEPRNTEEIRHFQERVIKDILGLDVKSRRVPRFGDQSFWGMGLPSMTGATTFSTELAGSMGGNAVWYGHTAHDTLDKVDIRQAEIPFRVYSVSLLRLCNNPVLPLEFVTTIDLLKKGLNDLGEKNRAVPELGSLTPAVEELEKNVRALNRLTAKKLSLLSREKMNKGLRMRFGAINTCLMDLSRILLPVLSSKSGKYAQDPMGTKFRPLPGLQPVERLASMDQGSEEYRALATSLLRERNRLSDTLHAANSSLRRLFAKM
jgi:hypothetical protein